MPQSKFSVWIFILALSALLTACGGSSSGGNEPEPITTPNSFSFSPQDGVTPGELVESNTITLTGITASASISISNGEYKIGTGNFTAEDGQIGPGQGLTVRATAPSGANSRKEVVVTVGGVSGSFIIHTMEDNEPPEASIVFPNVISATENTELTIRGTAEDALSEIARVTVIVNGTEAYQVESDDDFASWQAKITLTPDTEHTITVSVEDELGNVDPEAATAVVRQQAWEDAFPDEVNVFKEATGLTYDEEEYRVFIADRATHSVIEVDLFTGKRIEFFHLKESNFYGATALAIHRPKNRLLVTNSSDNSVYSLSLEGKLQPTLLNSRAYPDESQPWFSSPMGITLDPDNSDRAFVTASTSNNLAILDLKTGQRTLLSDNETPDDENPFDAPRGLLVDDNNNRILVGSSFRSAAVFSVDEETGKRTIFSGPGAPGGGIDFECPESVGSDQLSERILVGDCVVGIIAVDIDTGERTLIKGPVDGEIAEYGMYLYVEEGWQVLYYVDREHRALLMLDLLTKEHVILSKGARPD